MMKIFEQLVDWVLVSSADPAKSALTVRSGLVVGFGLLTKAVVTSCALGVVCVAIDQSVVTQVIDTIVNIFSAFCVIVGSVGFLAGLVRKIWLTVKLAFGW